MSRFSNKCDLWDWFSMAKEPNETPYETYLRLNTVLCTKTGEILYVEKPSDLVQYYPYYDSIHSYVRDGSDTHWLCPPEYNEQSGLFYKDALYAELQKVIAEEDPKYV